jgi:hypothetical protein
MEISGFPQTVAWALDFLSAVHPSRAALQPRLDGPRVEGGTAVISLAYPRLDAPRLFCRAVMLSPTG